MHAANKNASTVCSKLQSIVPVISLIVPITGLAKRNSSENLPVSGVRITLMLNGFKLKLTKSLS